jgi:PAS domain S-box-containing protein
MAGLTNGYSGEIIDFLPDATFVIDTEGKVIAWNRAMETMTGVVAEAVLGHGDHEYALPFYGVRKPMLANLIFLPGDEVERRYDTVERIGDTLVVDIHIPGFQGRGAYFWAKASPLYGPDGAVTGAIETIRDITDRKLAEQEAEQNRRELAEIIAFLPDATVVIDARGTVIAWNRAMEEMTGVPAAEMVGRGDHEYALPFYGERRPILVDLVFLSADELADRYDHIERVGDTLVVDVFLPGFKGGVFLWAKATPLYDTNGSIIGAIETVRDITDRKLAEQDAEQNRRKLSEIIDFLPDATFVIDTEGVVIAWNKAMETMTGVAAEAVLGHGDHEYALPFYGVRKPMLANLAFLPGDEVERRYDTVERVGDTLVVDIHIPDFQDRGAYFWAKASPLYDDQGVLTGAVETIRDITDRKEMEERVARSNAELQIAGEIQQSFLPEVIPQVCGFDIAARSVMAKEVGGDFFDVIPFEVMALEQGILGVLIADVSGKGVPAALFMALSRIVVRVNALWHRDVAKTIEASNNVITEDSKAGMFVTLFYGVLSEQDRTLTYVNAGHNPPLVYRAADRSVERLLPTGIILGARMDREYSARTIAIGPDDVVVLYTDGVTEAVDHDLQMFGEERLQALVQGYADEPAGEILQVILDSVDAFATGEPQFDDMTVMVIKGE